MWDGGEMGGVRLKRESGWKGIFGFLGNYLFIGNYLKYGDEWNLYVGRKL